MGRGRYGDRLPEEIQEELERFEEAADVDDELEDGDGDLSGTFDDIVVDDTFTERRGTVQIPVEDAPVEVDALPIPHPWQGLQRAAVVFNLNFVFNEDTGRWEREKKSEGDVKTATRLADGTMTVPAGGAIFDTTGVGDPVRFVDTEFRLTADPGFDAQLAEGGGGSPEPLISVKPFWDTSAARWLALGVNQGPSDVTVDWILIEDEFDFP